MNRTSNLKVGIVSYLLLVATACTPTPPSIPPTASAIPQTPTLVPPSETPTITPSPTKTPNPFPNPVLKITGEEEVVFDYTRDKCGKMTIPDLPVRALRDADGRTLLFISHTYNIRMIGSDLNTVKTDCELIMESDNNADPSQYNDHEWIASPYTEDGTTIYALIHNEYQGHTHPSQCPQKQYFPCWDNSLTLGISTDGGNRFTDALLPPAHLVARLPYVYEAGAGPDGARNPSNIIKKDGYYYAFFNSSAMRTQEQSVCLMRTDNLADPSSWRFWDGAGFNGQFVDPYLNLSANPDKHICPTLAINEIGASMNESITYNEYLKRYVLVGLSADRIGSRDIWGFYYSFSDDLIHWTHRKLLVEMVLPWTAKTNTDIMYLYPALIDPASNSQNYETTGKTAYLYYTRHNFGQGSLDRDLIRVPVEFFPSP